MIRFPAVPVHVSVPPMVCVLPLVNVSVCGAVKVKLLNVVFPETLGVAPLRVTVPEPGSTVPATLVQFPPTFKLAGRLNVVPVLFIVKF